MMLSQRIVHTIKKLNCADMVSELINMEIMSKPSEDWDADRVEKIVGGVCNHLNSRKKTTEMDEIERALEAYYNEENTLDDYYNIGSVFD